MASMYLIGTLHVHVWCRRLDGTTMFCWHSWILKLTISVRNHIYICFFLKVNPFNSIETLQLAQRGGKSSLLAQGK